MFKNRIEQLIKMSFWRRLTVFVLIVGSLQGVMLLVDLAVLVLFGYDTQGRIAIVENLFFIPMLPAVLTWELVGELVNVPSLAGANLILLSVSALVYSNIVLALCINCIFEAINKIKAKLNK